MQRIVLPCNLLCCIYCNIVFAYFSFLYKIQLVTLICNLGTIIAVVVYQKFGDHLKIAIPKFNSKVAPCFETAKYFLLAEFRKGTQVLSKIITCNGCEGYGRVRILRDNHVDLLICNGIKNFYRDLLESSGISVIPEIALEISTALQQYKNGTLEPEAHVFDLTSIDCEIPHEDLVCWAKEYFESFGYTVKKSNREQPFPIDLTAQIPCPVCSKNIHIAICCGAHTYRIDQDIREFHFVTPTYFDSQVYVYPGQKNIQTFCKDYGIEFIDPNADTEMKPQRQNTIPILKNVIAGHEKAFRINTNSEKNMS
jgi:predicted Fe-Mo cluster-binding NifX family protein